MARDAAELSRRLARDAEAVCRHYLPNGRRQGQYWTVGDARNTPGRSMFVRLKGPEAGPGAAGHWTDAATSEHGDLLDVIRESCGLASFGDVAEEARRFLSLPRVELVMSNNPIASRAAMGSPEAARRLIAMAQPIRGTPVEIYLAGRGIAPVHDAAALRYHPRCYYRPDDGGPAQRRPAMIASVTDLRGRITGAHRTWLAPDGSGKAAVTTPRRAMGNLLGHAVRFGVAEDVLAVGEGIETMLSLASSTVQTAFDRLRRAADVQGSAGGRSAPRMHDLRHSFAVHRLTAWYRDGADVQRLLPVLSTYLGHSDLEGTKVYLTMTPELLNQASRRFARFVHGGEDARA